MPMRAVSAISLKSAKHSRDYEKYPTSFDDGSRIVDFDHFVKTSCKLFECPISIQVIRKIECPLKLAKRHGSKTKRKRSTEPPAPSLPTTHHSSHVTESESEPDITRLSLTAVYNHQHELVEILMFKYSYAPIPRTLMKVIAFKVPFTKKLTKFTIKQCRIDMYTIYELHKILKISNITDICLDHSPLKEGNYDILLSDASSLQNLSLSRCNINDVVCERIASRLYQLEPAEPTLLVLNLSSNHITDVGAKHLAEALRNNRHLRYLNISDNHIGDDGAKFIFEVLAEFPLNTNEIQDKKRCYMDYLKRKEALYLKYMAELVKTENVSILTPRKKSYPLKGKLSAKMSKIFRTKQELEDEMKLKARSMALETIGPFEHTFCPEMVTVKEGRTHCIGNFTLCYLNLRYNNLTHLSVRRLVKVVDHQKKYRNEKLCGLVNVLLEGNYIPKEAYDYIMITKGVNRVPSDHAMSKGSIKDADKIKTAGKHRNVSL